MSAREIIATWMSGYVHPESRADCLIQELAMAGYRILGPDELDPVTVERCAGVVDGRNSGFRALDAERNGIATAIRSLHPEAPHPEAKEARE